MNFKSIKLVIVLVSALFVLVSFQNCGQPMPQEGDMSQGSVNADDGSYIEEFPFDTKVDQVAMMSCSQNNPADLGYFSFRAGAYQNQGVKLKESFSSKYLMKSTDQLAALIYNNPLTNEVTPRLSLVYDENSQLVLSNYIENLDKMSMFGGPLTMFPVFKPIRELKNDQRLRYLNQYEGLGRRSLQGEFLYSEGSNNELINELKKISTSKQISLAITHGPHSKPKQILGPKGYEPQPINDTFSTVLDVKLGNHLIGNSSNIVLKGIQEQSTTWSCLDDYKFVIFRMEDTAKAFCTARPDLTEMDIGKAVVSSYMSANGVNRVIDSRVVTEDLLRLQKALRRILDPKNENWFIDVVNRCVVPKKINNKNACYEKVPSPENPKDLIYSINYGAANCAVDVQTNTGEVFQDYKRCPHYVSLCNRFPLKDVPLDL